MDDDLEKKYNDEVDDIIKTRYEFIERHYLAIRESYINLYDWPELDPIRHEICLCIMFGLCQAAITLTNHFLESLLKYSLIILSGNEKILKEDEMKKGVITSFIKKYEDGRKKFDSANLEKTINVACTVGLISKEQKIQLHIFRDRFRNAYSHSDKNKIFGKSTVPVTGVKIENGKFTSDEKGEPEIASFLVGHGFIQAIIAQSDAPGYFLYIDSLTREMREKLFGSSDENSLNS